ncbi:MAG: type II toxin-antitoxin system RelE/ParE family toxin [Firmicutes bacterium]|nr:type II toxin-antitoxin system RelE/ParE family toxin [Bacillota bacterium]
MKHRLKYTVLFLSDLKEIFNYIAQDNPIKAKEFLQKIDDNIQQLESSPRLGKLVRETDEILIDDTRRIVYKNYVIYYSVAKQENLIYLERIIHGGRHILLDNS